MKHDIIFGVSDQRPQNDDNLWSQSGLLPLQTHSFTVIQDLPGIHHHYSFCSDVTEHIYSRIPVRLNSKITTSYYFNGLCKYQKDLLVMETGRQEKKRETGIPVCCDLKQTWVSHTDTAISHQSHVSINTYRTCTTPHPVPRKETFLYTSFWLHFHDISSSSKSRLIFILDTGPMH